VTVETRVAASADDAEEDDSGTVDTGSSDLELVYDSSPQTVGIRFAQVNVPRNAFIHTAHIQFQVDEASTSSTPVTLTIRGQAIGHAPSFTGVNRNVSSRTPTSQSVAWQPAVWPTVGQAGTAQQTADIAAVIQQIVNQDTWMSGNAMAILITGTTANKAQSRIAESYDGDRNGAPLLRITYSTQGEPLPTTTTTTLPPGTAVTLFSENFSTGLGRWSETGEGDWNTEPLHSSSGYPAGASGSPAAHSDNCDATCTITLASPLDLSGYSGATLRLLRFVDIELDSGEYLYLEVWNGTGWDRLGNWSGSNGGDDNTWHVQTYNLAPYLGRTDFRMRLVTHESSSSEHVHVDDVLITATSPGGTTSTSTTSTTSTSPTVTNTTATSTTSTTTPPATTTVEVRVAASSDDAEQDDSGNVTVASSDLEMSYDDRPQTVGIRFTGVNVPRNALIQRAYIQFKVDETSSDSTPVTMTIRGQLTGNAPTFNEADDNISMRTPTGASAAWQPPVWPMVGQAGAAQQTANIAAVIQQIVNQGTWNPGNALVIIITGTSATKAQSRIAESYDGDSTGAPLLHLEYIAPG
jgi:hypothetical protein